MTSMWTFMASWFTPTILFCFLNLIIGAIFIFSNFKSQNKQEHQVGDHNSPQLVRTPSLLERVKSINFSLYKVDHHYPFHSETQFAEPVQENHQVEKYDEGLEHYVTRSKSATCDEAEREKEKNPGKMKKSASENAVARRGEEKEEEVELRRPATVREKGSKWEESETVAFKEDAGVDAKADDFINRFKQQLKLQRLDSLLRYKEMLSRGCGR